LFRSGKQKQKRANKELFNHCTEDIRCFTNIRCVAIHYIFSQDAVPRKLSWLFAMNLQIEM